MSNITRVTEGLLAEHMKAVTKLHMDYGSPEDQLLRDSLVASDGFRQEGGYYVPRKHYTLEMVQGNTDFTKDNVHIRSYYEPVDLLSADTKTIPFNIGTSVRTWMQMEGKAAYKKVMRFVRKFMKEHSDYPHFIVGRKSKLYFSAIPFDDHPWVKHFKQYSELYRNELLAVALGARGITIKGNEIKTPKQIVDKVSDGVIMLLKKSTGARMGYYPGMWQFRMIYPFAKGLVIIWHDDSCEEYFNLDVLKLKMKVNGKQVIEPIPDTLKSDQMVAIANGDDMYEMRMSHQIGYLLKNTKSSKGGAWGIIPKLIANALVRENKDKTNHTQVRGYQVGRVSIEELMPDYIRTLRSAGLPMQFLGTVQQIQAHATQIAVRKAEASGTEVEKVISFKSTGKELIDTILLAARPVIGKMCMFAALTPESTKMDVGWYHPMAGREDAVSAFSDHIARVPFMAHGGGIQHIEWEGESPLLNTIMAIVESITPDEHEKEMDAKSKGEKYIRKDSAKSAKIWRQIMAMGADSDGDRLVIITAQGLKMLNTAGLYIEENPEVFKAKNQYRGLTDWTSDQTALFWETSTPILGEVGKGDSLTRDAIDAYKAEMFKWNVYYRFALHGAGQVQKGVSAPKYSFSNPYANLSPMTGSELRESMEEEGIGQGRKFRGMLWEPAAKIATELIAEFLPEEMEIVTLQTGPKFYRKDWKANPKQNGSQPKRSGIAELHYDLQGYSPEQGTDWPTVVRIGFFRQLTYHGITAQDVRKGLKGEKAETAQRLVREYIYKYPHRINVWAWFLDERMTGMPKDSILKIIGLPYEEPEVKE